MPFRLGHVAVVGGVALGRRKRQGMGGVEGAAVVAFVQAGPAPLPAVSGRDQPASHHWLCRGAPFDSRYTCGSALSSSIAAMGSHVA